jgi:hypothetical protein
MAHLRRRLPVRNGPLTESTAAKPSRAVRLPPRRTRCPERNGWRASEARNVASRIRKKGAANLATPTGRTRGGWEGAAGLSHNSLPPELFPTSHEFRPGRRPCCSRMLSAPASRPAHTGREHAELCRGIQGRWRQDIRRASSEQVNGNQLWTVASPCLPPG